MDKNYEADVNTKPHVKLFKPDDFPDVISFTAKYEKDQHLHHDPDQQKWGSNEHRDIGNLAFHQFIDDLAKCRGEDAESFLKLFLAEVVRKETRKTYNPFENNNNIIEIDVNYLHANNHNDLTPGDIIAMAGDFIGVPDEPIAFGATDDDKETRFQAAFEKLINANNELGEILNNIKGKINKDTEEGIITTCLHSADWTWTFKKIANVATENIKSKVEALAQNDYVETISYQVDMMSTVPLLRKPSAFFNSDYIRLLVRNFDHFGEEAKEAYLAGHRLAVKTAKLAKAQNNSALLKKAIMMECFAGHFITDLFAGGHVRTPRKELLNFLTKTITPGYLKQTPALNDVSPVNLFIAGFFANRMHDQDGHKGVKVKFEGSDETWDAKGDGNYYIPTNAPNARKAVQTMKIGFNDIFLAFSDPKAESLLKDIHMLNEHVPQPVLNGPAEQNPLFYIDGDVLRCNINVDLFNKIKSQGLLAGSKDASAEALAFSARYIGIMATHYFNVTLINNAIKCKDQIVDKVNDAAAVIQDLYDKSVENSAALTCSLL